MRPCMLRCCGWHTKVLLRLVDSAGGEWRGLGWQQRRAGQAGTGGEGSRCTAPTRVFRLPACLPACLFMLAWCKQQVAPMPVLTHLH
jgi:hypothetical protein